MNKKVYVIVGVLAVFILVGAGCITKRETPRNVKDVSTNIDTEEVVQKEEIETLPKQEEIVEPIETAPEVEEIKPEVKKPEELAMLVDCKSDFDCFSKRAETCEKTKFLHVHTIEPEETPGVVTSFSTFYEITGELDGKCQFYHNAALVKITATEEGKELAMELEGKTKEEIEKELEEANESFEQVSNLATSLYCSAKEGKDISDHTQKIFAGEQKIVSINGKTTYGTNIECTEK